jgi:hypothetical protein
MFHLLEVRTAELGALIAWMEATPVYRLITQRAGVAGAQAADWARAHVRRLVDDGLLELRDGVVHMRERAR